MKTPNSKEVNFKLLFESAPNLYMVLSPDFKIVGASDAYLKATMVERDQVIGRSLFDVFPDNPDDPTAKGTINLRASLERVLESRETDVMAIQKYDVRRPEIDGGGFEERHWSPLNTPVFGDDGEIEYIIHRAEDVTDLVKLKQDGIEQALMTEKIRSENDKLEKLRHSQRLEAMGALAGGVAHDFNNLLSIIIMSCEKLLVQEQLSAEVMKNLSQISKSGEKAAVLTRQLLAFSRNQILQPKVLNLNDTISNIEELLSRVLKENIEFKVITAKDLKNTLVDQGQLEQILMNLVINARDAMPLGGKITVETANIELDKAMAMGNMIVEPGPYVMLSVRDTGVGMDAKTQARIFEPFFTTKGVGKGTGLGLATVYGIVNQNKGTIWVYSEPNKGTVFKIFFPQVDRQIEIEKSEHQASPEKSLNSRTLLVVEDQEPLRDLICAVLSDQNYNVYQAPDGKAALDLLKELNYEVDLVITDVIMPEMGGQEMLAFLNSLGHRMKTLFLSGFTEDVLNDPDSLSDFLEKPFTGQALIDKVRSML